MRMMNVLLLLSVFPYVTRSQNNEFYKPWNGDQQIDCTFRFFPSNNSDSRALKAFQEVPIMYNSEICSSNPFQLSKGRKGAEVIEGKVSCAGTTQVGIQAEFTEQIAIRYFQIRCVAEFALDMKSSVELPFVAMIESWNGREVFGTMEHVWTAQVAGEPSSRGDWSTDVEHEWSLSTTYVAHSNADENVNVSIDLSLRSNMSRRQGNLPVYRDSTFICSLRVFHKIEDNETLTWKRVEGLSINYGNQNCEVDPVYPVEGVDVMFLREGGISGTVFCTGPARIEMLASYAEEARVEKFILSCAAGFPIDVHAEKALSFKTLIRFTKLQRQQNFRYQARTIGEPRLTEAWILDDEFQPSSLSSEYTFYDMLDKTVNITISLAFQSTANTSRFKNASVSQLQIYSDGNVTLLCSTTNPNDPPRYFVAAEGENPSEARALIKCLPSDNVADCAGRVTEGSSNSAGEQQLFSIKEHGFVYCRSKEKQTWLEYFTPITSLNKLDNFSLIWVDENVIHLQEDDNKETLFVPLPNGSRAPAHFYETQYINMECHFLPYILQQPSFWIAYANGTKEFYWDHGELKKELKQARDFRPEKSVIAGSLHAKISAEFGMNAIGCSGTYWNNARNATAIFPIKIKSLSEASSPGFLAAESIHLVNLGRPLHLNCLIDFGDPEPVYRWTFFGKNRCTRYIHNAFSKLLHYNTYSKTLQEQGRRLSAAKCFKSNPLTNLRTLEDEKCHYEARMYFALSELLPTDQLDLILFLLPRLEIPLSFKGLKFDQNAGPGSYTPFYEVSHEMWEGKNGSNLTIQTIGENMEGDYVCTAVNVRGNSSHRFKVVVDSVSNSRKYSIYIGVSVGVVACVVAIVVAVTRRFYIQRGQLSPLEIKIFENGDTKELNRQKFAHENAKFMPYDRRYEIDWEDFQISYHEKLGEGAYGVVFKGHMSANAGRTVAIKFLKDGADKTILLALLSELKVMIHLDSHENVVKLIGACTSFLKDGRVYLLVEFCPTGSVESYLRKIDKTTFRAHRVHPDYTNIDTIPEWDYGNLGTLNTQDLIGWAIQMARGMQHLESKKVVHGDLAARNILLYSKSHVKITDFGLSRQLLNYENYVKKSKACLPWRWLALETLKSLTFSHKSDVWGYGVTLWEIFTLGLVPYPGMAWTTEFVSLLEQNLRLHRPQYASENLYKIMYRCWDPKPGSRPDFQELEGLLLNLDD